MHTVLDLDLDYFVRPIALYRSGKKRLTDQQVDYVASEAEVRDFLENRCHLSTLSPILGASFVEHRDAFGTWRQWLEEGRLSSPFRVVHVDAHADLGEGSGGWSYLTQDILARPVAKRSRPRFATRYLNSGNFLAFAIANRWIADLTYVYPPQCEPTGLFSRLFRNRDWRTGIIEIPQYGPDANFAQAEEPPPVGIEPPVQFKLVSGEQFHVDELTHMVVAQSPAFTPARADNLLECIAEYFVA